MKSSRGRRRWRWVLGGTLAVGLAMAVWALFIEPDRLVVRQVELTLPDWPGTLDGMRVVVLTDLHVGAPHIDVDKLAEVIDEANAAKPDLVVILGDLVIQGVVGGDFVEPKVTAAQLGRLQAPHGVIAVLGNHDWWHDGDQITADLREVGIVVLEDDSTTIEVSGTTVWVAGVGDLMTRSADVPLATARVPEDAPALLLTHNPDVFPDVPPRVDLTLAGHTHGGQVCVPVLGPPVVPSRYGQRYAAGHVVEEGRHLYVGVGVGTSILPVRFGVPPAIDVLTLRATDQRSASPQE
ncbi:MAG: metallophosphoesterase [Deltaproteobacteria bacterium]|nr:metallophosphoesterase [Deltaproteobacteria bacterium]